MLINRRRRRQHGTPVVLNDIQTLVAALGGNAKVPAIYDTRYNVTTVSATATAWDDARGTSGYGPQLVGLGTTKPAWDATNKIITLDGSQNSLESAVHTAFDISLGRTVIFIGTMPTGAYLVNLTDAGVNKYVTLNTGGAQVQVISSTLASFGLPVAPGASRRMAMLSASPVNFFGAGVTPTTAQVIGLIQHRLGAAVQYYAPGGTETSGNWQLQLGHLSSYHSPSAIRAVVVLDHPATGSDYTAIRDWAITNHAIVADNSVTRLIFFDGNSLVLGQNSSAGNDYPSRVMAQTGFTTNLDYVNSGTGSRTGATQLAAFPTRAAPAFAGSQAKKVYVCWEITNDLSNGATAAQAVANVQACCQAAKAAGATTTVVQTCIRRSDFVGAGETARVAANNLLKALPSGIDVCVDTAAISQLSDPSNTTYFSADGVHLTDAGYNLVATDATNGMAAALTPYI